MPTQYAVTVFQMRTVDGRRVIADLALYDTARTTDEMERKVAELHRQFPAEHFDVVVEGTPA